MKRLHLTTICLLCLGATRPALSQTPASEWWLTPHRLLQTNLREIDATMNLDRYIEEIEQFGADVVLFNVGGIVANYPTELRYHYRNTYMKGDMVGEVLKRLHDRGIRMIGRFDLSKINEKFAAERPEWLYVGEDGKQVNYNGQVHTCVSGGYQQEYMFEILGEAVDRYPLDGVFFNMIGYRRSDYSGNYHGICQCDNCKRLFRTFSGMELPSTQDDSPVYRKYVEFTRAMSDKQFRRVNAFLKKRRPELAICTYTSTGVDVIRKESNSALGRGTYYDTEKAKWTLRTSGRRQLANAAVHFIRIPYRHAAVSPYLTTRRLWQQMASGAWLDFYCIGPLERQEDRSGLDLAARIYRLHARNEQWLAHSEPGGEVALVRSGGGEYQGLLKILSENQIAYELTGLDSEELKSFPAVIVPDAGRLDSQEVRVLDGYVERGGLALLTGRVPQGLRALRSVSLVETRPTQNGAYVRIRSEDKKVLKQPLFDRLDLVFLQGPFHVYRTGKDVNGLLRLIPGDMFGPPEKCYYRSVSDHPALLYRKSGNGAVACFTFGIGAHYEEQAHHGHAALLVAALDSLLGLERRLRVSAPPLVEIHHRVGTDGRFEWVSLYNHSGQRGKALHGSIPIRDIEISLLPRKAVRAVRLLEADRPLPFTKQQSGRISLVLPRLGQYEIVVYEYGQAGE